MDLDSAAAEEDHPNYYGGPRYLSMPDPLMNAIGPDEFSSEEKELLTLFGKKRNSEGTGRMAQVPETWLPLLP